MKCLKPPQKLLIKGKDNLIARLTEQSQIVSEYFKKTFCKNKQPIRAMPPTQTAIPFKADKIRKVIAKMKPNKSLGCDEIRAELIKYAPETMLEQITKIHLTVAEIGVIHQEK